MKNEMNNLNLVEYAIVPQLILHIVGCRLKIDLVGLSGLEPLTSPLSGVRSSRLSYRPEIFAYQISE